MEQYMEALKRANEIRLARSAIKRQVVEGVTTVPDLIRTASATPEAIESMTISDLLTAQRRWGETRARRALNLVGIRESRLVGDLTSRQRRILCDRLEGKSEADSLAA